MSTIFKIDNLPEGAVLAGTMPSPDFVIGSKTDPISSRKLHLANEIEILLNQNLSFSDYSENQLVSRIDFVFIVLPNDGKGIPWDDHKTIRKLDNSLIIHIRFPDYEAIVNGTDEESRKAMVQQLLRGANKFLPKVKNLNYKSLITDMTVLFQNNEWV